jgi:hypothetical protein
MMRSGESRLGLFRRIEIKNHQNLTTNVTREPRSSSYVRYRASQISKRDCPDDEVGSGQIAAPCTYRREGRIADFRCVAALFSALD